MMAKKLITAILGFKPDKAKDKLILRFKNAGNQTVEMEFHAAMLAPMAMSVMTAMPTFDDSRAKHFLSQPMTLTGVAPFTMDDGKVGLTLQLDGRLRFPVVFRREDVKSLSDQILKLLDAKPEGPSKLN